MSVNAKILHDLKRIATTMQLLKDELDRLYVDLENGNKQEESNGSSR